MGFVGKLRVLLFSRFPKEARLLNPDVCAACTAFWFMATSENVEHSSPNMSERKKSQDY